MSDERQSIKTLTMAHIRLDSPAQHLLLCPPDLLLLLCSCSASAQPLLFPDTCLALPLHCPCSCSSRSLPWLIPVPSLSLYTISSLALPLLCPCSALVMLFLYSLLLHSFSALPLPFFLLFLVTFLSSIERTIVRRRRRRLAR